MSPPLTPDRLSAARLYASLRWSPIPYDLRSKGPRMKGWPSWHYSPDDLPRAFAGEGTIGLLLVDGLCDGDLDCPEALALADLVLPETWCFSSSAPRSHRLYMAPGAKHASYATKFSTTGERLDPPDTLVELRTGAGKQVCAPPSRHKDTGARYAWVTTEGAELEAPLVVDATDLGKRVAALAVACLVARHLGLDAARAWLGSGPRPVLPFPEVELEAQEWLGELVKPAAPAWTDTRSAAEVDSLELAVATFNFDFPLTLPRGGTSRCPVCGHAGCFGAMPPRPDQAPGAPRWACFSAGHSGVGIKGPSGVWHGDALDLAAFDAEVTRVQLLRQLGYLAGGAL